MTESPRDMAGNIIRAVEMLTEQMIERVNEINASPQAWLNQDMRTRIIRNAVREVLIDYLLGKGPV